jgi:MFS transporter, ACS family, glucarate transporter
MKLGAWWLVVLLCLTASASYLCRVNISVTGALMMRDLGFSQIEMGRLFSAFVLGYAIFQVPAGAFADRWGARRVLAWAALWWVTITILLAALGWGPFSGAAGSMLTLLLILRFVLGVGEAPTFPAAAQGVAKWIQLSKQGLANGVVLAAVGAGSAVAPLLLSRVMVLEGWRVATLASAVPAMVVALAWFCVREPKSLSTAEIHPRAAERSVSRLWSSDFVLLTISYTLEGYVVNLFVFWTYLYLVQVRHFGLLNAGKLSSLPWVLSVISIPLGGYISDRLVAGSVGLRWGRRAIPMLGLTFAGIFLALGAETTHAYFAVAYLTLATASVLSVEGPFWATMMELAGSRSGTAGGMINLGSNIGGLISPALTPILAAHLGWENAMYVGGGVSVIAAALWFGISLNVQTEANELTSSEGDA